MTALEEEAADPLDPDDKSEPGASSGMRWQGRALRGDDSGPPDRAQCNFTVHRHEVVSLSGRAQSPRDYLLKR